MANKIKVDPNSIRQTATVELTGYTFKTIGGATKKVYVTIYKDELAITGLKEIATAGFVEVTVTKGKAKGKHFRPVSDAVAEGRSFTLMYPTGTKKVTNKDGKIQRSRTEITFEKVHFYLPTWVSTFDFFKWLETKLPKKPLFLITDTGKRVRIVAGRNTAK